MTPLLSFLEGIGTDNRGRLIVDIIGADDNFLENEHDYIQWFFPLLEPSYNVPDTPVIVKDEVTEVRSNTKIQDNLSCGLKRMTTFYIDNNHWLVPREHNHLRITRIIKSAKLLISNEAAEDFYNIIMERIKESEAEILPLHTAYWTDAIGLSFDKPLQIIRAN